MHYKTLQQAQGDNDSNIVKIAVRLSLVYPELIEGKPYMRI